MIKKILFVVIFFSSFYCISQNTQNLIDGLKKELKLNPNAKRTATIYSDLTWYYSNVAIDSAMYYGKKALLESTKIGDSTLIAQVYSDLGAVYFRQGNVEASKKSYLNAMTIRKSQNDIVGIAKLNANLANIYNKLGDKPKALKAYLATVDYFEKINNQEIVALTKTNIGILFNQLKNYPKALIYLKEALNYQEKNKKEDGLCTTYLTLGNVYLRLKDTVNALNYYNKSVVSSKKTSNNISLSSALTNIGNIKSQQNKKAEAIALFNKSKEIRDSIKVGDNDSSLLLGYAKEYIMDRKFNKAKELLLKMERNYRYHNKNKKLLLSTYQFLIPTCAYLNQPDSVYLYANEIGKLEDEIIESSVMKQTTDLEAKYQTAKKEKILVQKEAEAKHKNLLIIGLSVLTILIGLVGFLIYRQQKLKNKQQEQEYNLKQAISKIENQNKLQEQRLSISRDLHDNIGSQLTFIISSVDNVKYGFDIKNDKLNSKLTNISSFAKDTIIELRDTIWAMNSSEITFQDLENRINNFIEKAKEVKDIISFSFATDPKLKSKKLTSVEGMNIYRTIQEAINNAIKYANATIITVNIKNLDGKIVIVIYDNGTGFNEDTIEKGNGLNNMKKRIEEIKGSFNLLSSDEGTKIEIII